MNVLSKVLAEKNVAFTWRSYLKEVTIRLAIPDLTGNPFSVGGDWGPCYTISLKAGQKIGVEYREGKDENVASHSLAPEYIRIESPILASERRKHPFVFVLEDKVKLLQYTLYLNLSGQVQSVRVKPLPEVVEVLSSTGKSLDGENNVISLSPANGVSHTF